MVRQVEKGRAMRKAGALAVLVLLALGILASAAPAQETEPVQVSPGSEVGGEVVQTSPTTVAAEVKAAEVAAAQVAPQEVLPFTGFYVLLWVVAAAALVVVGGGLVLGARRSRARS